MINAISLQVIKSKKSGLYFKKVAIPKAPYYEMVDAIDISDINYGDLPEIFTGDIDLKQVFNTVLFRGHAITDVKWEHIGIVIGE
jgi:hypothetical protein